MSRVVTPFILLLAVAVAACTEAPTALPSADAAEVSEMKMGKNPPGQVRHIEALVSALEATWAAKDAAAYAALYAEDVEFIGPTAGVISGRDALRAAHVFVFSTIFAQSTLDAEVRRIQFLTGTIAIVDLDFTLTGFTGLPPGLRATEPGVVRHVVRWVVVKHRGEWQILGQQMTPIPPLP
ncbi:MAG: SgcJ/EcaC family oxidoreductase [Gemmatimonadetes bacterium]|nr:SgcJ/EcaC family oxidoreductase [Gemmatimonadota bacterium]